MNIHAAVFLLGCLPAQRCGAVYCHVLKSLHLDVVLTSFQTSFHMQLSRSSRPDASSHVGDPGHSSLLRSRSGSRGKRDLLVALAFQRAAQQIALCWACLLAVFNVLYRACSFTHKRRRVLWRCLQTRAALHSWTSSFQTSFHMDLVGGFPLGQQCLLGLYAHAIFSPRRSNWCEWHCDFKFSKKNQWLSGPNFFSWARRRMIVWSWAGPRYGRRGLSFKWQGCQKPPFHRNNPCERLFFTGPRILARASLAQWLEQTGCRPPLCVAGARFRQGAFCQTWRLNLGGEGLRLVVW